LQREVLQLKPRKAFFKKFVKVIDLSVHDVIRSKQSNLHLIHNDFSDVMPELVGVLILPQFELELDHDQSGKLIFKVMEKRILGIKSRIEKE
jgi:hypothetical protein